MIGRSTFIWGALAVAAGVGLFHVSYRVQTLEQALTRTNRAIIEQREAIHVLRAEWSYLNEPGRLAELTRRYLDLAPLSAAQMMRIEDLPLRIPPLMAEAPLPGSAGPREPGGRATGKAAGDAAGKPVKTAKAGPAKPPASEGPPQRPPTSITDLINRVSDQR